MIVTQNLDCTRGDTAEWTLTALRDSSPIDLTSATLHFSARRNYASPILFQRTSDPGEGIVIAMDPTTGVATVTLQPEDTLQLSNQLTVLVYDVQVFVDGEQWTVIGGELTVNPVVGLP